MLTIRNEIQADRQIVEDITCRAFYTLYVPGCGEHCLVHIMRDHPDFIPELDFVAELDGQVIGNVMYTRATLTDEAGAVKDILTFGPVAIAPEHQRKGYGKQLLEHSFRRAAELGWDAIVIFGSPANYVGRGFKSCKKFNVCLERKIPVGHDGERAERGGAGRQEVSVPGQPGDGPRRGGGPALRRHPGAHGAQVSAQPGGVLYHEPFLRGRGVSP